jgi:N-formylglutamate amidohydrolase
MWTVCVGDGPLVATAIHNGHQLRSEVAEIMAVDEGTRLREEDPFTSEWTVAGDTRIIALRSRFEVDLNRPREKAVYIEPRDAWGLEIWKSDPPPELIRRSLAQYDAFYEEVHRILTGLVRRFGRVVVLDLHSYNHRREGPDRPPDDPEKNPEVNIGTGTMETILWMSLVNRFMTDLRAYDCGSRRLDVRENVKFKGGWFSRWIHQTFPESVCALAVEFKKFFMDEWTGDLDRGQLEEISLALRSTVPGITEELKRLGAKV